MISSFEGNTGVGGGGGGIGERDCLETQRSAYGPFRALRCHLVPKLKHLLWGGWGGGGRISSVGSVVGSLSCVMLCRGFEPSLSLR